MPPHADYLNGRSPAFLAFLGLLWLAPLPLGGNRPLPLMLLEVGLFSVCSWSLLTWYQYRLALPGGLRPYLVLGGLWLGYHLLQLTALPWSWVQTLSPAAYVAYARSGVLTDASISLSVDRYATFGAALETAAYLAAFAMAFIWCASLRRMTQLMQALVLLGVAQVFFGWFAELLSDGRFAWVAEPPDYLALEGTYVNPNHLAGLLEMSIGAVLGLLVSQRVAGGADGRAPHPLRSPTFLWFSLGVLATGLLATASRGGIASSVIAVILVGLPTAYRLRLFRRQSRMPMAIAGALILASLLVLGTVLQKLDAKRPDGGRLEFWRATFELLQQYPLTGSGGGTYAQAMAAHKPAWLGEVKLDHAHNDYLELLAEYGVVGALVIALLLALVVRATLRLLRGRDPVALARHAGLAVGLLALLLHGTVDFNLQIPANALWFTAIAGALAGQSARRPGGG